MTEEDRAEVDGREELMIKKDALYERFRTKLWDMAKSLHEAGREKNAFVPWEGLHPSHQGVFFNAALRAFFRLSLRETWRTRHDRGG